MNTHETFHREAVKGSSDRSFGFVFTGFFAIVAFLPRWSGRPVRWWAAGLSALFLVVALLAPKTLAPLNRIWTRFGELLQSITNPIVLGILFFIVFTPMGFLMRFFGRDALRLKFDENSSTYWLPRQPPGPPPASMADQF